MSGAAIYTRVSRDKVGAGLAVERQEDDCRALAEQLGLEVAKVYEDNDISAYSGKPRPRYKEMLADIAAGRIDVVLCWHTDRLHRSPVELEEYMKVCGAHGVPTHTVKAGNLDLATPSGQLVARQLGAVARYEIDHARERIKRAREQQRTAGTWGGGRRPFGYEPDGITVRDAEAAVVRDVASRLLTGESLHSIAAGLNAGPIRTSTGNRWTASSIRVVMLRPRNAAIISHKGKDVGPAAWPPLIEEETWRAVNQLLTDPVRGVGKPGAPARYLGSGLYRCGKCGAKVLVSTAAGRGRKTWRIYRCGATRRHIARRVEPVDQWVVRHVHERLSSGDLPWRSADPTEIQTLRVAQETQLRLLAGVDRAYTAQDITEEQWRRTSRDIRARLDEVTAALADLATPGPIGTMTVDQAVNGWDELPLATKKAVIDAVCVVTIHPAPKGRRPGGGYFDPATIEITWRAPGGPSGTP